MAKRKICVVTGTRAEYGLLYWLMKELKDDKQVEFQLLVTGSHLSPEFGYTVKQIEEDGFRITKRIEILLSSDSAVGIGKAMGLATISFTEAFAELKPDILVMLGDRFEMLAVGQAATACRIPIAHIFGGEITEGAIDDAIRHALTKLSHMHFPATEKCRRRIIQMGESPDRVFKVGAISLDNISKAQTYTQNELEEKIRVFVDKDTFLVTYHPVTIEQDSGLKGFNEMLQALGQFPTKKIIFTLPNADQGGRQLFNLIKEFSDTHRSSFVFPSLGQKKYLSALMHCSVVIGNSSSGIIEAPSLGIPTVNIGPRQDGRERAPSVFDVGESSREIVAGINKVLSPSFRPNVNPELSPYYSGNGYTSEKIKNILVDIDLKHLLSKNFYQIKFDL